MKKSRILTLKTLKRKGACIDQLELFEATFGKSAEVTVELAVKHASQFNFGWAACNLLTAAALAEYEKARAAARAAYEKARAAAFAEYEKARAAAFAEAYINDVGV